ncbi:hypothetical protein SAMN05443637_11736 [Pseudonocardia thermophila]|jgi:hypothetical protein|uniref:Uncharacterized protein n=1 Tax=Pseudonocardia thermophila TaxID=1848 RepID=A0A1M6XJT0_PSETH|nr:hypothetical protein [Pseudonocardia thermophila]SHL06075.1 hypothetical protein SAMN05443637_11736 [Pseudonocardia thermophila]
MTGTLTSARYEVADEQAVQDLFVRTGWGDGLPVVAPTPERVERFVAASGRAPDEVVGVLPEQARELTVEKIAVNAVAAGCREEYMSVLLAAVRALTREEFCLHSTTVSGATAPLLVLSGPIVEQINVNTSYSVFGPGHVANATIGRAVRLILQNLCGGVPGLYDKATFGHPGKFSYCIGESRTANPWEPLHADRGVPADESAVTVFAGEAPINARNDWSHEPGPVLATIADAMLVSHYTGGCVLVVLGPLHAAIMARAGMRRADVQAELFRRAHRSVADLVRAGRLPPDTPAPAEERRGVVRRPEDVLVTVAGGDLYGYSAVIPYWIGGHDSTPVTEPLHPRS